MPTKPIIVEYLIIVKQEDTFCDSEEAFLRFLDVDSSFTISSQKKELTFSTKNKADFKVGFVLTSDLVPSKMERYFKLILSSTDTDKLDEFTKLTTGLENVVKRLHAEVSINLLWNDIARKYAIMGYEAINEVENLLRRLITSFMLINVGYEWYKLHIPKSVEERDGHLKQNYSDYLHQTYFSDLKTILFEGQREPQFRDIGEVQLLVQRAIAEKKSGIAIEDLKGIIATSLWEKYFSKDTSYKKQDLENDLEKLNVLRNEIAHNRHINRETLGKIHNISKKIIQTLKLEIEDLPNKKLTVQEQKFQINTELLRLSTTEPSHVGYFAEKVVYYWYKKVHGESNVMQLNTGREFGVDLVVRMDKGKRVGVQIKATTKDGVKKIRNQLSHGPLASLFGMPGNREFDQVDIVLVILDYSSGFFGSHLNEIEKMFEGFGEHINFIVGYVDDLEAFVPVNISQY